ncbi:hypothetical protein PLESTB_000742500 [Pleodorina starrii]|uniref:DUF2232 domain-containing protein n=1 Tax=Pleodorina starrii TaxID=330485 RepID=A0A9W6F2I9_9CHLO|nr:hypothetical protein PLESTM_000182200 [Pleodorina starrii]GLC53415.1 hypothetical protein PLESTB_000742500 [Pleodorina starrii]GLC69740.1 hypothetical protein PLESTF_000874700 [Pleodorina starrii]
MQSGVCPFAPCPSCPSRQAGTGCRLSLVRTTGPAPPLHASTATCCRGAGDLAGRPRSSGTAGVELRTRGGRWRRRWHRLSLVPTAMAQAGSADGDAGPSSSYSPSSGQQSSYTLEDTRTLVETAMLAAVSGLAYLLSTILKLENSLGYFLPLPVVLAALRSGPGAGWRTMTATCFLLVVLLGPLRAMSYLFLHGLLAATLGSLWSAQAGFWPGVVAGALVRMVGQLSYLVMSSVTMNENMFALLLSNVYNMLDQTSAALGLTGAPSVTAVNCTIFSLLLINGLTYCFLVHVVYRVMLGAMGYQLGPLPGIVSKYLNAGAVQR